jgi:putative transposase
MLLLSKTFLELPHSEFCVQAIKEALWLSKPVIFNSDQGVQFTSDKFTGFLETAGVRISMDGRRRLYDNVFVERLDVADSEIRGGLSL